MKSVPKLDDIRSFGILAFRIRWTDFSQSFHRMKAFWVQMIDLDLFLISQGTLPWQPILGKICEMAFIQQPFILKRDALSSCGCTH